MSDVNTLSLAQALIARPSVTPEDAGCLDLIMQRLDPLGDPVEFSALEVHVSHLRRKVGADCIRTVRGVGYMLEVQ